MYNDIESIACPPAAELQRFAIGDLSGDLLEAIARHILFCPACERQLGRDCATGDSLVAHLRGTKLPPLYEPTELEEVVRRVEQVGRESPPSQQANSVSDLSASQWAAPDMATFCGRMAATGLLRPAELAEFRATLPPADPGRETEQLALELVRSGKLTRYQAATLYQSRPEPLVLGEYVVLEQIGQGGMGRVYQARHRRMDRVVAIKVLAAAADKSPDAAQRFQREVRAAARLEHPNIVTAFDAGESAGVSFLVMQFVDGADLALLVKKRGPLPVVAAVQCIAQVARGLAYAHHKGIVHRDIKPANMLLDAEGTVKILDMGLARLEDGGEGLTGTDQVMGTIDYMSPEQTVDAKHADARSDIYGLGCSLWYLLTASRIYEGESLVSRIMRHREAAIPSLCQARHEVRPELDRIFQKMVAKQPADRYQTMDELAAALEGLPWADGKCLLVDWLASQDGAAPVSADHAARPADAPVAATVAFSHAEVGTDPNSEILLLPPSHATASPPAAAGRGGRALGRGMLIGAGGLFAGLVLLGVILIVRDRQQREVGRIEIPDGGSLEFAPGPAAVAALPASANADRVAAALPPKEPLNPVPPSADSRTADRQRRTAQWLLQAGARLTIDSPAAEDAGSKRTIAHPQELPAGHWIVTGIELDGQPIADHDFSQALDDLPDLQALSLRLIGISDVGLASLGRLTHLQVLKLREPRITDALIPQIAALPNLSHLNLQNTKITLSALFQALGKRPLLVGLDLGRTSEDELSQIASAFPNLRSLATHAVSDRSLALIASLPQLAILNIAPMSETGAKALENHKTLNTLTLQGRPGAGSLSDGALRSIAAIAPLKLLRLDRVTAAAASLDQFRRQRPDCRIEHIERASSNQPAAPEPSANADGVAAAPPPKEPLNPVPDSADGQGADHQRRAAQRLLQAGARLTIDSPAAKTTLSKRTIAAPQELPAGRWIVTGIELDGQPIADHDFSQALDDLPNLQAIMLREIGISDVGLTGLGRLTHLQVLKLRESRLTDAVIPQIAALPKLARLNVQRTKITLSTLFQALGKRPLLEQLDTSRTSDDELGQIVSAFPNLRLFSTEAVSARSLPLLASLRKLEFVSMAPMSEEGAKALEGHKALKDLILMGRLGTKSLSDGALRSLAAIGSLKLLRLVNVTVSATGLDQFRQQRPDCRLEQTEHTTNGEPEDLESSAAD